MGGVPFYALRIAIFFSFAPFSSWAECPKNKISEAKKVFYQCDSSDELIKRTIFIEGELTDVDHFLPPDSTRPFRREVHKSKYTSPAVYDFFYQTDLTSDFKIDTIEIKNFKDELTGTHMTKVSRETLEDILKNGPSKPAQTLIIDTGFNWTHKSLIEKHYINKAEKLDGTDTDGDGLIDNITTLNGTEGRGGSVDYLTNINQVVQLPTKDAPLSHGGFVASVAMKDVSKTSFIGAGGDIYSPSYLYRMLGLITKHQIDFVNMSFGFGDKANPIAIGRDSFEAISGIMMAVPETLFVVASGNGSRDFDQIKYSEYPACYKFRNLITVGALNTDKIEPDMLDLYSPSHFSNVGERCVDIFAPGEKVLGAGLGQTMMRASGTSVSSPFVLNVLLKMKEINPKLKSRELKKILLDTAYIPKSGRLPARSGGIVNPEAAYKAVHLSVKL